MKCSILLGTVLLAACAGGGSGNAGSSPSGDILPRLMNEDRIEQLMERQYPPTLLRAGIGGEVTVMLSLDAEGVVQEVSVRDGSGYESLDSVAVRLARQMRFTPALNNGKALPIWITHTITFRSRDRRPPVPET